MQPPQHQQPPVPPVQPPDSPDQYVKRRRTVLWCTIGLLALSVVILVVGLVSSTRTSNVPVAGFYPGIILSFGSFLGIVGINLVENRRPMLVAAIIFISLGVKACFFCAIVDGVIAADFIDWRPLMEGRCSYFVSGSGYGYDNYYTEVTCQSYNSNCNVRMKSNTCYCCDLYNCERPDYHEHYYQFTGVAGCWDVIHLHRLLWSCVVLNIIGLFLGIINAALLGAFKDLVQSDINQNPAVPQVPLSPSPAPPPHILYNPTQHMLSYSGFCPSGQTLPAYPNYPLPMQHLNSYSPPTPAQPSPEALGAPPEETQPPSQNPNLPAAPCTSQAEPSGYMLTPNAPTLYPQSFSAFEKPPPYAC